MFGFKEFLRELTTSASLTRIAKNVSGMPFADKLNDPDFIKILSIVVSIDPTVAFPQEMQLKPDAAPEDIYSALVFSHTRNDGQVRRGIKLKLARQIGGDHIEWIYDKLEKNEFALTEIGKHANIRRALSLYPRVRHLHDLNKLDIPALFLATEHLLTREEEGQIDSVLKKADVNVVDQRGKYMLIRCDSVAAIRAVGNATPNIWCVRGLGQASSYFESCKSSGKHFFYIVKDGMLRYAIGGGDGISDIANRSVTRDRGISVLKEDLDYLKATQSIHNYEICKDVEEITDPTEKIAKTLETVKSDYFSSTVLGDLAVLQREFKEYPELLARLKKRNDSEGLVLYASILARRGPNNPLDAEAESIIARNASEIIDYISSVYKRLSDKTKTLESRLIEAYDDDSVHFDEISDYVGMLRKVGRDPDERLMTAITRRIRRADIEMLKDLVNLGIHKNITLPDETLERLLYRFGNSADLKYVTENFNVPIEKLKEVIAKSDSVEGSDRILLCHTYGIKDDKANESALKTVKYLYTLNKYDDSDISVVRASLLAGLGDGFGKALVERIGQVILKNGHDAALYMLMGTDAENKHKQDILKTIIEHITKNQIGSSTVGSYIKYITSSDIDDAEFIKTLANTLTRDGLIDYAKAICKHAKIRYGSVVDELNAEIYAIIRENRETYNPQPIKSKYSIREILSRTVELLPSLNSGDVVQMISGMANTKDVPDDAVKSLIETYVRTKPDGASFIYYLGHESINKFVSKELMQASINTVNDADSAYRMYHVLQQVKLEGVNIDNVIKYLLRSRNYHAIDRLLHNSRLSNTVSPDIMFRIHCGMKDYATALQYAKDSGMSFDDVLKRFKAIRTIRNIPITSLLEAGMTDEQLRTIIDRTYRHSGNIGEFTWVLRHGADQSIKDRYCRVVISAAFASPDLDTWELRSLLRLVNEYSNKAETVKFLFNALPKERLAPLIELVERSQDYEGVLKKYLDALIAKKNKKPKKAPKEKPAAFDVTKLEVEETKPEEVTRVRRDELADYDEDDDEPDTDDEDEDGDPHANH